jgi:hypothetical protein
MGNLFDMAGFMRVVCILGSPFLLLGIFIGWLIWG